MLILPGRTASWSSGGPLTRLANTEAIIDGNFSASGFTSASIAPQSGSNRFAVLLVSFETAGAGSSGAADLAATWGASSFTKSAFSDGFDGSSRPRVAIFTMKEADIPGSTQTITVSASEMSGCYARLVEYENVDQTTPIGALAEVGQTIATTKDITVNMTSTESFMVSCVCFASSSGEPMTVSSGTELFDTFTSRFATCGAEEAVGATGNNTHTYTASSGADLFVGCGVEILGA